MSHFSNSGLSGDLAIEAPDPTGARWAPTATSLTIKDEISVLSIAQALLVKTAEVIRITTCTPLWRPAGSKMT